MAAAAILLAAGASRRMGAENKLLIAGPDGRPMVAHSLDRLRAFPFDPLILVLGHDSEAVAGALDLRGVTLVQAPDHAAGLSQSLRAGLAAVPETAEAVLVALGDMPLVAHATIAAMLTAFRAGAVVVPRHQGQGGNPVLWDRRFIAAMRQLSGDRGARSLLPEPPALIAVDVDDPGVLADFDTPQSLTAWRREA